MIEITNAFPDQSIDPRKKNRDWIAQFAKACWWSWSTGMPTGSIFYSKVLRYNEVREYALGRQSIYKYRKQLLPDETADESWTKIDWGVPQDLVVIRNIVVAKLQKAGYNIIATPINPQAKDAQDKEYAKLRSKTMLRNAMQQQNPELANHPALKKLPGEPDDMEELQMQVDFSPKLVRSKDVEEAVQLVFYEQDYDKLNDAICEDVVDFGVGGCWDSLDENNKVCLRKVVPEAFACSYTRKGDFSDITWAFEIISMKGSDLSKYFGADEIQKLINMNLGKNGNPTSMGMGNINNNGYDQFKFDVMVLKFLSYDKRVTEENKDSNGNLKISKTKPSDADKVPMSDASSYTAKTIEVRYKCKWVIGTDMVFDYGKDENQDRTVNIATMGKTKLGLHLQAANFDKMRAQGLTESLIPIADEIAMLTFKMRHFVNRMVPPGYDIDMSALENGMIGASGQKMKPMEVLDFFFETGNFVGRRPSGMDHNVNYKAINPISNPMREELTGMMEQLASLKQRLSDQAGVNTLTDASTPNPKTLASVANLANESTNNAIYFMVNTVKKIRESAARGVISKMQIALKRGAYSGYNKSSNSWISVPRSIIDYDYDIMIEDVPTEDQRQIVYQMMQSDIANGFISHSEVINIIYTNNLKQMAMQLAYKVDKGKEKQQANSIQNTQNTAQMQMQSNQAAEEAKRETDFQNHLNKMAEIDLTGAWQWLVMQEKNKIADSIALNKAHADIIQTGMQESTKQQAMQQPDPNGGGAPAPQQAQPQMAGMPQQ